MTKDQFNEFKDEILERTVTYLRNELDLTDILHFSLHEKSISHEIALSDKLIRLED